MKNFQSLKNVSINSYLHDACNLLFIWQIEEINLAPTSGLQCITHSLASDMTDRKAW